jgi:DNA-directed RNA polymerase specialized sigma24 family protein
MNLKRMSELKSREREFLEIMTRLEFARIEKLVVSFGMAVITDQTKIVKKVKLSAKEDRPQLPEDFELKSEQKYFFERVRRMQHGVILSLEIKHGLPFILEVPETACVTNYSTEEIKELLGPHIINRVEIKAKEIVGKAGIRFDEVDDISQEIYLSLFAKLHGFDPCKGKMSTFTNRIIDSKIADIIRSRTSGKNKLIDLSYSIDDCKFEQPSLANMLMSAQEQNPDLKLDVESIMDGLGHLEKIVCRMLMEGFSQKSIQRVLKLSRSSLDLIIKETLTRAFKDYKNN